MCKVDSFYSPTGQVCGKFVFNKAAQVSHTCSIGEADIFVSPTKLPGWDALSGSDKDSENTGSSTTNKGIAIGVLVLGFVAVVSAFVWWFCLRKNSCYRKRRREGKYQAVPDPIPHGNGSTVSQIVTPSASSLSEIPLTTIAPIATRATRSSGPLTYRVENIPESTTWEKVTDLFTTLDSKTIVVKSVAPAFRSRTKTATIVYKSLMPSRNPQPPELSGEGKRLGIHVDSVFDGFTPLNEAHPYIRADVVAVTGLAGHAFGSWSHDRTHNWLRDYLPKDMPELRVMTWGYQSKLEGESRQDLETHARDFAGKLRALWESTNYDRPTILIGHSLGCLLIMHALIMSRNFPGRPQALERFVPLVIFFGAPHGGLNTNALETLVEGTPSETLIKQLKPGSPALEYLSKSFKQIGSSIKVVSVFERLPTPTAINTPTGWDRAGEKVMMVKEQDACLYWEYGNETRVSSQTDHKGVAKLEHSESGPYENVITAITSVLNLPEKRPSVLARHNRPTFAHP